MSIDDKLRDALQKYDVQTKKRLADAILRYAEEERITRDLRTYIRLLKVLCPVALLICGPIVGFLFAELSKGTLSPYVLFASLVPIVLVGIITAIVDGLMKVPPD